MASIKVAEFLKVMDAEPDTYAAEIGQLWYKFNSQRRGIIEEWKELRNFIFATDTSTTSNKKLPWNNKTTRPKLCQIRDNLHANYISALFPNDDWLKWEGYSVKDSVKEKAKTIEGYIANKAREGHFKTEMSKCLYDYIDYGNCFATVSYETRNKELEDGSVIPEFIGAKLVRISPLDIVFNPLAASLQDTFKIIRSVKTIGELKQMAEDEPDNAYLSEAIERRMRISKNLGGYTIEDQDKAEGFLMDGFGSMQEYYQSGYVELLEFTGDFHNSQTGELERGRIITVVDRNMVIRNEKIPSWLGRDPVYHAGWRTRPDNLWAMSPLANLVGLQYRIDHLENLKADAMDLAVNPPLLIKGEVEQFIYAPSAKIHVDEGGDIGELGKNLNGIVTATNEIERLESSMELYAGAPREAMGIRTAGEKTAFEVSQLQNAAGRIFQEKINTFEIELLEPVINAMLEVSQRNLTASDVIRVMDDDLNVETMLSITKEDITAAGKLRPVGARHFAAQAQLMQNLNMLMNSQLSVALQPHMSTKALASLVEDSLNLSRYQLFSPNVAIYEQLETQKIMNQAQEEIINSQEIANELEPNENNINI